MTNLELAALVEAAEGPSRELDALALAAFDWKAADWEEGDRTPRSVLNDPSLGLPWLADRMANSYTSIWRHLPSPTASLDAAMTLLSEGQDWALSVAGGENCLVTLPAGKALDDAIHGYASTPALALLAAILRADGEASRG